MLRRARTVVGTVIDRYNVRDECKGGYRESKLVRSFEMPKYDDVPHQLFDLPFLLTYVSESNSDGRLDAQETEGRESREVEAVVIRGADCTSVSPLQPKALHSRHAGGENREIMSRHKRRITPMTNCQLVQFPGG